jgi:hypothetical protein
VRGGEAAGLHLAGRFREAVEIRPPLVPALTETSADPARANSPRCLARALPASFLTLSASASALVSSARRRCQVDGTSSGSSPRQWSETASRISEVGSVYLFRDQRTIRDGEAMRLADRRVAAVGAEGARAPFDLAPGGHAGLAVERVRADGLRRLVDHPPSRGPAPPSRNGSGVLLPHIYASALPHLVGRDIGTWVGGARCVRMCG